MCEVVDIYKMQYEFMPEGGTVNLVFVLRRLDLKMLLIRCQGKLIVLL